MKHVFFGTAGWSYPDWEGIVYPRHCGQHFERLSYLADYLEAGRKDAAEDHSALRARVPADPQSVLCEVARRRMSYQLDRGRTPLPDTKAFWDALTCDD